jgi:hypothetical protein
MREMRLAFVPRTCTRMHTTFALHVTSCLDGRRHATTVPTTGHLLEACRMSRSSGQGGQTQSRSELGTAYNTDCQSLLGSAESLTILADESPH